MTTAGGREEQVRERLGQDRDEAGFKRLLQSQEQLRARTGYMPASGKNRLEDPPDKTSRRKKAALVTLAVALLPFLLDGLGPPSLKRMLGGVSAEGRLGSWASQLSEASRALGGNRSTNLLVTDQRLLLASYKIFGKDRDYAINLEIPRDALAQVAVEGRPFARGRVAVRFIDGSMIALDLGTWRTATAHAFVQALAASGTVAGPPH